MKEDLSYLECFVLLSETLSFSETADLMSVSQPCVSRQIKLLEERLNSKLFIRDKHRIFLSETGRELKSNIGPLVKELQRVLKSVREQTTRMEGTIGFASLQEVGQSTFLKILLNFQVMHPGIQILVEYMKEYEIVERIKKGEVAFGIVTQPLDGENIRAYPLFSERGVLVTRANNIKKSNSILDESFVLYRHNDPLLSAYFKKHNKGHSLSRIKAHIIVNSHRSMIDALLASDCYAVMPLLSVEEELAKGRLILASPKEIKNGLFLATLENSLVETKNAEFLKFLLASCKELPHRFKNGEIHLS
jgi:DNA-binding transcriptional LysR family regulator